MNAEHLADVLMEILRATWPLQFILCLPVVVFLVVRKHVRQQVQVALRIARGGEACPSPRLHNLPDMEPTSQCRWCGRTVRELFLEGLA